jgi:glycosyltransferase involved in cell wall biosynthesis
MTRPLNIQFVITSLPVGGAETLLLNLIEQMDRENFSPEVVCLKEPGPLGPAFAHLAPLTANMIGSKWDVGVLPRLAKHFRRRCADAVITVGAGDKMFWGRLAAWMAGVPVICSALHSTGWPDGVGRLNRLLTPVTDAFIAVAKDHARFMCQHERFPADRVFQIPNGVDTSRFRPNAQMHRWLCEQLNIECESNLVGIVAALRPEKNHHQFIEAAVAVLNLFPRTHFVIVGDGPERAGIEQQVQASGKATHFHLLGSRSDTAQIVAGLDVFCLTSRNEANPVSILEALSCAVPVVAPNVGSIHETVLPGRTGILTQPLKSADTCQAICQLLSDHSVAEEMGLQGRTLVQESWSLQAMVAGYQDLVERIFNQKRVARGQAAWQRIAPAPATSMNSANMQQPNDSGSDAGMESSNETEKNFPQIALPLTANDALGVLPVLR